MIFISHTVLKKTGEGCGTFTRFLLKKLFAAHRHILTFF
jgi:hypothetical protein